MPPRPRILAASLESEGLCVFAILVPLPSLRQIIASLSPVRANEQIENTRSFLHGLTSARWPWQRASGCCAREMQKDERESSAATDRHSRRRGRCRSRVLCMLWCHPEHCAPWLAAATSDHTAQGHQASSLNHRSQCDNFPHQHCAGAVEAHLCVHGVNAPNRLPLRKSGGKTLVPPAGRGVHVPVISATHKRFSSAVEMAFDTQRRIV